MTRAVLNGPYINEDGDLWIERGTRPWPQVLAEAKAWAPEISDSDKMRYLGIEADVRVSDNHDSWGLHRDDDGCADSQGRDFDDPEFQPCCRTIVAYHFQVAD